MAKPCDAPANWIGEGLLIRPGLTPLGAKTKLYEAGFELLGTGACAAAFQLGDSDRCVKLVCDQAGHRAAVQMFRDHPEIEAFPRIYGYVDLTGDCFAYETELLDELSGGDDFSGETWEVAWEDVADAFGDRASEIMRETCEGTVRFSTIEGEERHLYFDLHDENYMEREDGGQVVIDPFHLKHERSEAQLRQVTSGERRYGDWDANYWDNVKWRARQRIEVLA